MAADYMTEFGNELDGPPRRAVPIVAVGAAALAVVGLGYGMWRVRAGQQRTARRVAARWVSTVASHVKPSSKDRATLETLRRRVADTIRPAPREHHVRSAFLRIATAGLSAAVAALAKHGIARLMRGGAPEVPDSRVPQPSPVE